MPEPAKTTYHFTEASSPAELRIKSEALYREGWRKSGNMRQIEIRLPGERSTLRYSQSFSRTIGGKHRRLLRCLGVQGSRPTKYFWGEIAPCDHWLQVYPHEEVFFESLENFVAAGLEGAEAVVVIATGEHTRALDERLKARGLDMATARIEERYIALDAEEAISRFMINGWPDEDLFQELIRGILTRARRGGRRVRAFGEMVALLWSRGECGATVRLEHLWHVLCQLEDLPLFCAYPSSGLTQDRMESLEEICALHSRIVV